MIFSWRFEDFSLNRARQTEKLPQYSVLWGIVEPGIARNGDDITALGFWQSYFSGWILH